MRRFKSINLNGVIDRNRLRFLQIVFVIVFISLTIFLFKLQVLNDEGVLNAAINNTDDINHTTSVQRGNIYFTDKSGTLIPVAINKSYSTIAVDPKTLQRDNQVVPTAKLLSPILNRPEAELINIFQKSNSQYEVLLKKTEDDKLITKIKELKLPNEKGKLKPIMGISISEEFERYYPFQELGCHVIGFIAKNNSSDKKIGVYGLEKYYNDSLDGTDGVFHGLKDAAGRLIRSLPSNEKMPINGDSLITTIDKNIQYQAETEIKNLVDSRQAVSGSILVMDPVSGKMLAIAGYPNFNLNEFFKVNDYSVYRNLAIEDPVEMGSVVKVITMTAGIDSDTITPKTTYYDSGAVTINNRTIKNFHNDKFGTATMTKVLQKSINTGAIFVEQKTGHKIFYDYLKKFKFNDITGIDLPNEQKSVLKNLETKYVPDINFATASYGHGISITPIAILRSYAVIANGGYLVNPYVVETTKSPDGTYGSVNKQDILLESIIKPSTAKTITNMMVQVVEDGYGSSAKVKGYSMAGKTGTADISYGKEYTNDTIQSFGGFFPASNPKVVMLVVLNKPAIGMTASTSVTYGFHDMAKFIIDYYNIPPDEPLN
ncbi:MAG TPA: penicillin-binding protein 2 [Candidatus Paceibacterota bacterium]|nr:penicillin-binding protein 2 [Candidatus Paceibacterota bacterium]HRZ29890.1 penicillin-binding protein 2 [Candidatus Paceibacterota bacterium]